MSPEPPNDQDPAPGTPAVGLDPTALAAAFPFHFVVDPSGSVEQVGPSLARLAPALLGATPTEHFEHHRGKAALDLGAIAAAAPSYVLLRHTATRLLWRGQTLRSGGRLIFVGAPWVASTEELEPSGLSLDDFAPHDPISEYLTLLQEKHTALRDATSLSRELRLAQGQLQRQLHETQAERRKLGALIETVPWGVLVEDTHGRVATVNEPFCRLFAVDATPDDLVGRDTGELTAAIVARVATPDAFHARAAQLRAAGAQQLGDPITLVDSRVLERDYVPVADQDDPVGHLWVFRDVTRRHQAAAALEDARQRAEDANTAKSEFLAMMSHEMRTPLGVIVGIAELLQAGPTREVQRDLVQRLGSNSRSLLQLIDASLDFARLEKRQLDVQQRAFGVDALLDDTVDSMGAAAARRGLQLLASVAAGTPRETVGDGLRLRQVLINLVNNAIKFTDGAEVRVTVRSRRSAAGAEGLLWTVSDHGPGIPAHRQERVFERFVRADASESSRSGTGLGLAICRELCEAMGGSISVESGVGRGSTFCVWLPHVAPEESQPDASPLQGFAAEVRAAGRWQRESLCEQLERLGATVTARDAAESSPADIRLTSPQGKEQRVEVASADRASRHATALPHPVTLRGLTAAIRPTAATPPGDPTATSPAATRRTRVLLVDDDQDSVDIHGLVLAQLGASVVAADGVEAALARLREEPFDLVLTDLRMPGGGGLELIAQVDAASSRRAWPKPPVVVLSAEALEESRDRVLQRGACGYVTKPVDPTELDAVLAEHSDPRPLVLATCPDEAQRALAGVTMAPLASHRFVTCASTAQVEELLRHYPIALALIDATDLPSRALVDALHARGARAVLTNAARLSPEREAELGCEATWREPLEVTELLVRVLSLLPDAETD